MKILVAYDIQTVDKQGEKRLRQVARVCQDYGQRVQKSVFECSVGDKEWVLMRGKLLAIIDLATDSLRFYFLDADCRIEHHGSNKPYNLEEPLII